MTVALDNLETVKASLKQYFQEVRDHLNKPGESKRQPSKELQYESQELERVSKHLQCLESKYGRVIKEKEKVCQQNEALGTENTEIKKKLVESNTAMIKMDNQLQQKARQLENALSLVSSLEQHFKLQSKLSICLESNNAALEIDVQQLNIKLSEYEEAMRIQEKTVNQEIQRIQKFQTIFKDLVARTDKLKTQAESLKKQNQVYHKEVTETNKKLANTKKALRQKDEQLQQQDQEVHKVQEALREFQLNRNLSDKKNIVLQHQGHQQEIQDFEVISDDLQEVEWSVDKNQDMQAPKSPENLQKLISELQKLKQTFLKMYKTGTLRYWIPPWIF
ncbi:hypothetical protein GOODEAATRI_026226 [Goodea atripinnis]|uniref:Uncharacterized protein n=1 Tax=Goodea atripinnis TaxID=208336 RepID=A0ABV0NNB1_9TELE